MKEIIEKIKKANNIAIFTHRKPDPDAIGSAFAFYFMLKQLNKKANIFLEEHLKKNLDFFATEKPKTSVKLKEFDLVVALDCGSALMLGKFEETFKNHQNTLCIDHHAYRTSFAQTEYVNTKACSTCEILFNLFNKMKIKITKDIATALYAGIIGDTGRFLHPNTTSEIMNIGSKLLSLGADFNLINTKLFKSNSLNKMQLLQIALSKMVKEHNILYCDLTLEDYGQAKCLPSESYEIIGTLASIEGVDIAILFNEIKKDVVNISFRSTPNFNVAIIAQNFGGGGHKQASGITEIQGKIADTKQKILKFIKENKKAIQNNG